MCKYLHIYFRKMCIFSHFFLCFCVTHRHFVNSEITKWGYKQKKSGSIITMLPDKEIFKMEQNNSAAHAWAGKLQKLKITKNLKQFFVENLPNMKNYEKYFLMRYQ